jgi:hypothetical protein
LGSGLSTLKINQGNAVLSLALLLRDSVRGGEMLNNNHPVSYSDYAKNSAGYFFNPLNATPKSSSNWDLAQSSNNIKYKHSNLLYQPTNTNQQAGFSMSYCNYSTPVDMNSMLTLILSMMKIMMSVMIQICLTHTKPSSKTSKEAPKTDSETLITPVC